jgi:DNA-binding Lrp family transcriptional regulator
MDKIDKKILNELIENSRIPLSKLGKNVRLSRENVYYRIQNMIRRKIIKDFVTFIDYKKIGFNHFTIFIEFDKIDKEKESQIIDYLKKEYNVSWIGILSGSWSLTFDVYTKTNNELNVFINKFFNKFNKHFGNYIILNIQDSNYYFNKIINENVRPAIVEDSSIMRLDKIDLKILKELNEDSRISYVDIAEKLKLTPNAIKNRIKILEKKMIIQGYSISINHKEFGMEWNGLQIKIKKPSSEIEEKIKNYLKINPKVIFYYQYNKSGIYDFDIGIIAKDSSELREFINDLRTNFYDEITITNTFIVLEEVSSHNLPKVIFLS